jgi:hypothetical protein
MLVNFGAGEGKRSVEADWLGEDGKGNVEAMFGSGLGVYGF